MNRLVKGLWICLVMAVLFIFPRQLLAATDYWFEDFIGAPGVQPSGWRDATDTPAFNAEIAYSYTNSWASVTCTASFGKVLSAVQNPDVATFPSVEVNVTGISGSTSWRLGIQEEEGTFRHWDLSGAQSGTGFYAYNYASATGWNTGTHQFSVELVVEGGVGTYVEVDSVRISIQPTPTPTPTVVPVVWEENFDGTRGQQPSGWQDTDNDPAFNTFLFCSGQGTAYLEVSPTAGQTFGKTLSQNLTLDVDQYPFVEIRIPSLDKKAFWKAGIQEQENTFRHVELINPSIQRPGIFVFNYAEAVKTGGWGGGSHQFSLELVVEGGASKKIEVDSVRFLSPVGLPTPVVTPTPYADEFDLTASPPQGWMYALTYTASSVTYTAGALMYARGGYAYLTFTALGSNQLGKAISTSITVDTDVFPELDFWVTDVYPFLTRYTVSLWTQNVGIFQIFDSSPNHTGIKRINFREMIRQEQPNWGGPQTLNVEVALEGESGSYFELDYLRFQEAAPTPTITPTPVANTLRPSANLFRPDQGPMTIQYMVQSTDTLCIAVFNTAGRKVRMLLEQNTSGQVSGSVEWDGKNEEGDWVGSGVYIIRIESKDLHNNTQFFKNVRVAVAR